MSCSDKDPSRIIICVGIIIIGLFIIGTCTGVNYKNKPMPPNYTLLIKRIATENGEDIIYTFKAADGTVMDTTATSFKGLAIKRAWKDYNKNIPDGEWENANVLNTLKVEQ